MAASVSVNTAVGIAFIPKAASGIAVGLNKGHIVTKRPKKERPSHMKGRLGEKGKIIRGIIREVVGWAPYERRIMEILKGGGNNPAKRAWRFAKNRLGTHVRAKQKVTELTAVNAQIAQRQATQKEKVKEKKGKVVKKEPKIKEAKKEKKPTKAAERKEKEKEAKEKDDKKKATSTAAKDEKKDDKGKGKSGAKPAKEDKAEKAEKPAKEDKAEKAEKPAKPAKDDKAKPAKEEKKEKAPAKKDGDKKDGGDKGKKKT